LLVTIEPRNDEAALVRAAQAGDRAAFGEIYRQFSRMIHGILLAHVRPGDAEDLMQDVFMRAMQRLPGLREAGAVGGWLASIARHAAIDHHRRVKPLELMPKAIAGGRRPDQEAFEALDMLRSLPEAYRETLALRLVEGMTGSEIAARTGLTHESVRVNLCRGMKLLREKLEQKAKP